MQNSGRRSRRRCLVRCFFFVPPSGGGGGGGADGMAGLTDKEIEEKVASLVKNASA
jgi:hypothetical protein